MPGTEHADEEEICLQARQMALDGTPFVDVDFQTENLKWGSLKQTKIYWKRPAELCPVPRLFGDAISACYVRQGRIGDCFFIAALSLLCAEPDAIKKVFMGTLEIQQSGLYRFQFFEYGQWRQVVIDDQLPTRLMKKSQNHRLILGRCSERSEFWVSLVEKAYAKFYGSYESIRGGNVSEALVDLTGAPVNDYSLDAADFKHKPFWAFLLKQASRGAMIGCAFCQKDETDLDGDDDEDQCNVASSIQTNHAYAISRVLDTKFDGKSRKLLLVEDPQRDGQRIRFSGQFSDPAKWSDSTRQALKGIDLHPGAFWMTWKEFRAQLNRVYICQYGLVRSSRTTLIRGSWDGQTAGGCTDYASWRRNPAFELSGEVVAISLHQSDRRRDLRRDSQQISYTMIGLTVVKSPEILDNPFIIADWNDVLGRTAFWNKRDVAIEVLEEWPKSFVVVPSCHQPEITGEFVMNVYSKGEVSVRRRSVDMNEVRCAGSWTEHSSGGGPLSASFSTNPRYILDLDIASPSPESKEITLFIGLRQIVAKTNRHKIGICLLKRAKYALEVLEGLQGSVDKSWFLGSTTFNVKEEINRSLKIRLEELPVLVIPCTWEKQNIADFELTVYTRTNEYSPKINLRPL